jgi:peptidyl-prolyl cis-trans isomerase C
MKQYLVAALAVLCFALPMTVFSQQGSDAEYVVVTVNDEPITAAELNMVLARVAGEFANQGRQPDAKELRGAALNRAIDTKLLAQEARKQELKLEDGTVERVLAQIEKQVGGRETLDANLATIGLTRQKLTRNVQEAELAQRYLDTQIAPGIEVSDEQVKQYYEANPEQFEAPEQVRARHILIKLDKDVDDAQREQARKRAEAARERAVAGEDFAALASELSEGPSASKGGDLGFFEAGRMVKPFSDAAFALEPGEVSPVVETRFGYHVIKLEERKPAETLQLEKVFDNLRGFLASRRLNQAVSAKLGSLRETATIVTPESAAAASAE